MNSTIKKVLIAGFGRLGCEFAKHTNHQIIALSRTGKTFYLDYVKVIKGDLKDNFFLKIEIPEVIIFMASPDSRNEESYKKLYGETLDHFLKHYQDQSKKIRLLFISSTAVYEESDGSWVDENTPINPIGFRGRWLSRAEKEIQKVGGFIVRFPGLYSEKSGMLASIARGKTVPKQEYFTNRIHLTDAARLLDALVKSPKIRFPIILACDDLPIDMKLMVADIAHRKGYPPPILESRLYSGSNKRVSNKSMKAYLPDLIYPSYIQGYHVDL